ncbi:MAG: hypothetical protein V4812_15330 [Pseudomonadota bacterium]
MGLFNLRRALTALFVAILPTGAYAETPKEVRLDYAYYAPTSLVLKAELAYLRGEALTELYQSHAL